MAKIFNKVFPIYNADGTPFHNLVLRKATYESSVMSLGDKITGDVVYKDNSLEFTMGEYISFKSNFGDTQDEEVKFFLVNPPTVTREGVVSNSSDLKGATKYSLEFYHPMYMLSNFPFSDVAVSSDEKQYLSENKTFSWIGNPIDFFAKLNKNLQGTEWVVIKGSRFPQEKETELSEVLSFDKNTIADALKTCYDTWGVPFVVDSIKQGEYTYIDTHNNEVDYYDEGKRFVVLFGLPSSEIYASVEDKESDLPYIFEMGQGLGLKNNSRTPKNNKIITRIAGYGSERNVPYGYPQIVWYGNQDWDYTINNDPNNPHSYPIYKGIVGGMYVKLIKHPFTRSHLMPSIYSDTVFNKVSPYLEGNIEDVVNTITYSQWYEKANDMVEKATEEGKEGWELDLLINLRDVTCLYTPESAESLPSAAIPTGLHTYTTDQGEATINVQESNNIVTIEVDSYWYDFTYKVVQIHKTLGEENPDYDPDLDIVDYYDAVWSQEYPYVNEINPLSPSYEAHEFEDIYPRLGEEQIVAVLPYEQEESVDYVDVETATSKLEEQEELVRDRLWAHQDEATYYTDEIQDIIDLIGNADVNEEREVAVYKKMWFTNKSTQVDIITWKITSDDYFNYVSFSSGVISFEMKILFAVAPPVPTWDDSMDDDGNYKQSYFKLTLPQLDFDVYACASITEEMQINMRSGACIGCTFTVQVDWDDYKKNFYDSEGRFLPHGEQRNLEKYPDSSTGNITLIVQKDLETFGTIMPNIYQQPQTGDDFVILGISLPKSYITNAEEELDDASKSYMLENNVYYFEYPLKFDEKFLTDNDYILSQIRNNAIVRFLYYDTELELFVSQLSVKYGESPLPQYSITLTDNIEVVLNQIGQVTEDVEHVSSLLALLRQTYSNSVWSELADKASKTYDNVLQGVATFLKGIKIGTLFGITEQGDATLNDVATNSIHHPEGKWNIDGDGGANFQDISSNKLNTNEISTQTLTANEAHFFNLIIDEVKSVGGQIVVSPANAEIIKVVETNDSYVCYFKAVDQDGNGIDNQFVANDLALHMEFNVSNNGTRNYWRKVVSVVSNTNTDVDGVNILCHSVRLSKADCKTNSATPQVGDGIVVFGNTDDTSRQNAIVISAYNIPFVDSAAFMGDANGIQAPLFVEYSGVNGFNVTDGMRRNVIARNGTRIIGDQILMKTANQYVSGSTTTPIVTHKGEWVTGTTAKFYEEYTYGDCTWLCINANGTSNAPSINSADWKLTAGVTTYDIEITSWWMYHEEANGDLFSLDCYFKVYKTLAGTRTECNPSEIVVRAGLDVPTIQPDYPAVLPYVNNHYAFLLEDYLISQFADLPSQFFIEVKDTNSNPLAKYDTPVTIVYNGKDGTNGRDGQSYTMRGSAMKFYQDIDDFIEWVSDHAIQVTDGDRVIIDDSDPSGTRGSEVYVYDSSYVDPITDRRYWKLEREAAIGDAYIIRFKDNDPDLQRPSWNFDGHVFVATDETLVWQEPNWQWWTDLGKIVGEDGADGADGKDGIAFYFEPAIVVLEEVLTVDPTTHAAHTTIASQEARLKFNRGGTEGYAILSTILTPPTGGFSASLSNNTLTISYNGTTGTATESSVIVQGSITSGTQTIQVTQTLSLKINRLGQAQLSLMNGLASLLVGGTVYDSNGTARTFESGIQTSKTSGFIGTMVNGLAAAGIEFDATDVTNTILKLIADKVKILLPDGQTQVALFSYEKGQAVLNTDLIKAQEVVTNGLQANTIDADNAIISNLNVRHAEIEESVFKGDIYTPPFVLDEDNIGEKDEQGNYKYITNDSALGWVIDIKKTGKNLQINTNYCQDGAGSYIDLNFIGLYNPTVQTERDALIGAECNIVYTPRSDADIHLNAYVYNNGGVTGTSQYLIWTPALHPMSFIKCKYTKFYDFNSAHTEKYGWVVIDYHNVSTGIFPISGTSLHFSRGLSFSGIRTVLQDYTLTKDDFFILVSGTSNITLTLPTYPNMNAGQTYMIRLIVNRTVYLKSSSSNISYNGVNLSNTYNTSRGSIIFVTYVGGIWQVAHMTNG